MLVRISNRANFYWLLVLNLSESSSFETKRIGTKNENALKQDFLNIFVEIDDESKINDSVNKRVMEWSKHVKSQRFRNSITRNLALPN